MSTSENRILIFVSERVVGELTAYRLDLLGMTPILVRNEAELEREIEECLPSLLLLDLDHGDCDSMAIIEGWSSNEVTSRIPVLCMSGEGDLGKAERAYFAGAREFVVCPYDPIVMENKVLKLLAKAKQEKDESQKLVGSASS